MHTVLYLPAGTFDPVLDPRSPHNRNASPYSWYVAACQLDPSGFRPGADDGAGDRAGDH
eukprot:SAG11_NODE_16200_length_554_cov_2.323077_2_plen_58_part_01